MYKSPEQRFQRTRNICISPSTAGITESIRCNSPKIEARVRESRQSYLMRSHDGFDSRQEPKDQVEDKIQNLQKMLLNEKSKRQTQFASLFKMINSIKKAKANKNQNQNEELSFVYTEQQFPMTPRVKNKENEFDGQQSQYSLQTYTPVHETVSKAKQSRSRNFQRQSERYRSTLEDFSLKSLEILLQKIEREAEFNNRNIFRIQEEISSIRSAVTKAKPRNEIPIQIQKLVRDSTISLKNQIESQRMLVKKLIAQEVQQQLEQKLKNFKPSKAQNYPVEQFTSIYSKIDEAYQYIQKEMKLINQKSEDQLDTMNEIMHEKFTFFRQSLLDQIFKQSRQDSTKLTVELEKQKKRINEIQESNSEFYTELEETMENIQEKLRAFKTTNQIQKELKEHKEQSDIELVRKIKQQQKILLDKISLELNKKLSAHFEESSKQAKILKEKMQSLENPVVISQKPKLMKYNSLNTKNQTCPDLQSSKDKIQSEQDYSPESNATFSMENEQSMTQMDEIVQLICQNCTFLEQRNCAIEESMSEVVFVLNNIVGKLNNIM